MLELKNPENYDLESMEIVGNFCEGDQITVVINNGKTLRRIKRAVRFSRSYGDLYFMWNGLIWLYCMFE